MIGVKIKLLCSQGKQNFMATSALIGHSYDLLSVKQYGHQQKKENTSSKVENYHIKVDVLRHSE